MESIDRRQNASGTGDVTLEDAQDDQAKASGQKAGGQEP
jgi:hypothetical protein